MNETQSERNDRSLKVLKLIKQGYKESVKNFNMEEILSQVDKNDCVTLFHGTTSVYLNDILKNGILPRSQSSNNNWETNPSIENVTYLTNKWHYFYARSATNNYMDKKYGEDWLENEDCFWWNTFETLPCYVECKIPKALLIADEDLIYSRYFVQKVNKAKNKNDDLTVSWEECLAQYGTVGVLGAIPPEYIVSFTVLGDAELFVKQFIMNDSQYMKDFAKWQEGRGKGKLKLTDLLKIEQQSDFNGTWWLDPFKGRNLHIERFGINSATNKLTIVTTSNNYMENKYFVNLNNKVTEQYKKNKIENKMFTVIN